MLVHGGGASLERSGHAAHRERVESLGFDDGEGGLDNGCQRNPRLSAGRPPSNQLASLPTRRGRCGRPGWPCSPLDATCRRRPSRCSGVTGAYAITLISTVGLVGLAIAPWQVLLLVNVPYRRVGLIGVRVGIAADATADLHRDPVDALGALLGTATIVLALVGPTLFVNEGTGSEAPWMATAEVALAAPLTGETATANWSTQQTAEFQVAVTIAGLVLTVMAAALVGWGIVRTRSATNRQASLSLAEVVVG
jgi:hypothetical protein